MDFESLQNWIDDVLRGAPERGLTPGEIAMIPEGMARALDLAAIRIIDRAHNPFALGKILVRGSHIYWDDAPRDLSHERISLRALFVHELAHVWQYRTGRLSAARYILKPANWEYRYDILHSSHFDDYGVEKQADLVQDWYRMREGHAPRHYRGDRAPTLAWLEMIIPFARPPYPAG